MVPKTHTVYDSSAAPVTGSATGPWISFQKDGRTHNTITMSFLSGTGTVALEGRITPNGDAIQLTTGTADKAEVVAQLHQYRVTVTSGAALSVRVECDRLGQP